MRELRIALDHHSYSIYFAPGLLADLPRFLPPLGIGKEAKLYLITDEHLADRYARPLLDALREAGYSAGCSVMPAGEKTKSMEAVVAIAGEMLKSGCDRSSVILALGGGVVGDLAGFVAAVYMRGIRYVQLPTTILAHDSSVGGKVAVNHPLAKNILGAFYHPLAVFYDLDTLKTLPPREVYAGMAEVLKHGAIWDRDLFCWLVEQAEGLIGLKPALLAEALYRACQVKVQVVQQDERETGLRAILNFGHTIGHAVEAAGGYDRFLHGEAVAIGMALEARIAEGRGMIPREEVKLLEEGLARFRLPTRLPGDLKPEVLLPFVQRDKKNRNGQVVMALPREIGKVEIVRGIGEEELLRLWEN